jgi:hypothetical protein
MDGMYFYGTKVTGRVPTNNLIIPMAGLTCGGFK